MDEEGGSEDVVITALLNCCCFFFIQIKKLLNTSTGDEWVITKIAKG